MLNHVSVMSAQTTHVFYQEEKKFTQCKNMVPYSDQLEKDLKQQALQENIQKFVVGAAILNEANSSVLMLKRHPNDFMPNITELPSGGVNGNETLREGLIREINEETGLEVKSVDYYVNYFDYRSRTGKLTRQFNFLVSTIPGRITLSPLEHTEYFWHPLDEKDLLDDNMQKIFNIIHYSNIN